MKDTTRITLRLDNLAAAIDRKIAKTGETRSQYIRRLIAADCRVKLPKMKAGNPLGWQQVNEQIADK
jgi:hypothetical protein